MKILAWTQDWNGFIDNGAVAFTDAIRRDPDFVPAFDYHAEPQAIDAVFCGHHAPPLPPWIPKDAVKVRSIGDPHRFNATDRDLFAATCDSFDLVTSMAPYAKPKQPNVYYWPSPSVAAKTVFFPAWAPDAPPPHNDHRRGGVVIGASNRTNGVYAWRSWVSTMNLPDVATIPHPGYTSIEDMVSARNCFFAKLAQYKVGFTCHAILDYTVAKYIEIPYAGCILVAERPNARDTELIGFRDGYNCLFIDGQDEPRVRKVYADILAGGYPYMAARGQQLVLSRHTASHRLAYMKRLILWYKVHRRVPNYEEQAELFIQ